MRSTASQSSDERLILLSKLNLAKIDVKAGRAQAAIAALRGLADHCEARGLKHFAVQSSVYLGEALLGERNIAQARRELERARHTSAAISAPFLPRDRPGRPVAAVARKLFSA